MEMKSITMKDMKVGDRYFRIMRTEVPYVSEVEVVELIAMESTDCRGYTNYAIFKYRTEGDVQDRTGYALPKNMFRDRADADNRLREILAEMIEDYEEELESCKQSITKLKKKAEELEQ